MKIGLKYEEERKVLAGNRVGTSEYISWEELVRSSRSPTGSSPEVVKKWSRRGSDQEAEAASKRRDRFDSNERRFTIALHRWRKVAALRDEKHKWHSQVLKVVTARGGCRSASLAMRCGVAGPISAKQRKRKGKQSNVSMDAIGSDDCRR
ncbi:hypothetical protein BHE74_00014397 [Ensete ventricosum]|nr:hypothetical protein BHE74_00014397 [Ensete ventricosum]